MNSSYLGGPTFGAFVVTAALVIAGILLFRSLSKHLRKVRTHPPDSELPGVEDHDGTGNEVTGEPGDR